MNTLIKIVLSLFSALVSLSLFTMMAVFMGKQTPFVSGLLSLQTWLLIPVALIAVTGFLAYYKSLGWREGNKTIWSRTPGWLIFSIMMLNSLVVCGFIACTLVLLKTGHSPSTNELIPLLFTLFCSLAFVISYTYLKLEIPPSTYAERNSERGSIPLKWHEIWKG